ncbi:MAG: serine/threonine protein kinase [Gemmatimonadaceae bacterium]|nr:serine/threonine protein kinase [Gemmatimonadaceae bacterium]
MESLVGSTLAGYTLRAKVGEGGTSTVYRAEHPTHGTVAIKVLREKLRHDRTAVQRFLREAQFGQRVVHPNIVRTLDFGEADNGRYYLSIDWAAGELLEKYAERKGPLPPAEVAEILRQLSAAVKAAHDVGIVHRDLKPENVMYDPEQRHVMLLDFGIAADTEASPDQRLTRAGFFVGTLMYVAPEALSGELVGPAADQYSLATIAYFLLSGALPYAGKTPRELFSQLLTQPPTPLNRARPGLTFTAIVESVIMKALAKAPADRYAGVGEFAEALVDAVARGGEPVPAPPPEVAAPAAAPAARPQPARAPTAPAADAARKDDDESGGLFGKMKSLFRR